jgi:hypothetical protein
MKKILSLTFFILMLLTSLQAENWCDVDGAEENREYALLSKEVYNDKRVVEEWRRIKDYKKSFFGLYTHGLHLSVYKHSITDKIAIVIEGTDTTDIEDLLTNVVQLTNSRRVPREYRYARDYVKDLIEKNELYRDAVVTGHSLGGGIAQYVAWSFGMKAYAFNSAGLSDNTVEDAEEFFELHGDGDRRAVKHLVSNNNRGQRDIVSSYGTLLGTQKFIYVDKDNILDLHAIKYLYEALVNTIEEN